ncbi:MAG TPA: Clp protease N-terminal domain-containing protein [Microbacterium sp.]|nr:Clp protease N-terminal domain-containing protein [Microbacterium sp.]
MFERFTQDARTAVEDARNEAERRGDSRIGSEHLVIALLRNGYLAKLAGADAAGARDAADRLDRAALAAIGLDLGEFRPTEPGTGGRRVRHLTAGARSVLGQSLAKAGAEKSRTITPRHLMLALLDRPDPDPAAALLAALPIDAAALRARLGRADR